MQYTQEGLKKFVRLPIFSRAVKLSVLLLVSIYIINSLKHERDFWGTFVSRFESLPAQWPLLLLIITLMPVNWLLEARKWQYLSRPIERIGLMKAFQGVLTGLSLGLITPHTWGDYAGRIWYLDTDKRERAIGAVLISRVFQMVPTLVLGLLGLALLRQTKTLMVLGSFIVLLAMAVLLIIFRKKLLKITNHLLWFNVLSEYRLGTLLMVMNLSWLRFAVFSLQFFLTMHLMGVVAPNLILFGGIFWIFFAKSFIPSFSFLGDLGVREFAALYFFEPYGVAAGPVVSASLLVWTINIMLPAFIGLAFVWRMKIVKSTQA